MATFSCLLDQTTAGSCCILCAEELRLPAKAMLVTPDWSRFCELWACVGGYVLCLIQIEVLEYTFKFLRFPGIKSNLIGGGMS